MADRISRSKPAASGSRIAAAALLLFEALWWAGNIAILVTGVFGLSPTAELLLIIPVAFLFMTLLAVFLLIQAPRGGIWLGLSLQVVIAIHGFVLLFLFETVVGAFELPLAAITALCLAVAANERLQRRE